MLIGFYSKSLLIDRLNEKLYVFNVKGEVVDAKYNNEIRAIDICRTY